jgi:hypothetical protein
MREIFDRFIEGRHGTPMNPPRVETDVKVERVENMRMSSPCVIPNVEDAVDAAGKVMYQQPAYDASGTYDHNPILKSIIYVVEFPDGTVMSMQSTSLPMTCCTKLTQKGIAIC